MSTGGIPDDPKDMEIEALRDLLRREMAGEEHPMLVGPWTAYMLVGMCQWGIDRLGADRQEAVLFRSFASSLEPIFAGSAIGDILAASWREYDAEIDRHHGPRGGQQ